MKITAQWIAEQCGVSRGTVDRVVNGRPNVAPAVRERVQKVIREYGYTTPAQRHALRAEGTCRIGVLLPGLDALLSRKIREGLRLAARQCGAADVDLWVEELKSRSHRSYFEAIGRMEEKGVSGLIVAAPDTVAMAEEIDRLAGQGVPVVACCADVRRSGRLCYVGADMEKSGRVAAGLIAPFVAGGTVLALSDQREFAGREARMRGFLERMRELAGGRFHVELVESAGAYDRSCEGLLQRHPHVRAIYMPCELAGVCLEDPAYLRRAGTIRTVCHGMTAAVQQYLERGRLDFAIDQNPLLQAARAVEILVRALRTGEPPRQKEEYMDTRIITRELL